MNYNLTEEEIRQIAFQANDYGKDGVRVVGIQLIPPESATETKHKIVFEIDDGPTSATELWR